MEKGFEQYSEALGEGSKEFFRDMVERMPGGFFVYRADDSEELLYVNMATLRIFGCENRGEFDELTGGTFRGMVHPKDLEEIEKSIAAQIAENTDDTDYVEYRIKQKDGSTRWVTDYGHLAHTEELGDIFCVFISDDTERMKERMDRLERMNDALVRVSARESRYRKAILYDALFFYEVGLTDDKLITAVTRTREADALPVSDLFNSSGNLEGACYSGFIRRAAELIDPADTESYLTFFDTARLIRCCENGELEQIYDRRAEDNLGRSRLIRYVVLLGESVTDGGIVALITVKDITEQNEHRRLLRESLQQARAAEIAKSTFLANMSHDIKTPLNAILGFIDLIKLHIEDKEKIGEYLEKIRVSGNQLLNIASEALEVTRMESGKASLAETEGSLSEMLAEVGKTFLPEMDARGLHFKIDSSGVLRNAVFADLIRIKEILGKLLDNAAKYTEPGGFVSLRVSEEANAGGFGRYVFTVEDTGCGISEEFMERLFEPFARASNTTESGVAGSGLGLAVVKNLVDLMEGDIKVVSRVGEGSRFTVTVVLRQLDGGTAAFPALTPPHILLKGKRVLLVEDNEINSEIAEALLTENGFIVETASDGDIAVETVKNSEPGDFDLVLMDIQMPRMNGYEATRAIRALPEPTLARIPIIALSANTYAEDRKKAIDAGMDEHAPKPIDMARLMEVISSVLKRRAAE